MCDYQEHIDPAIVLPAYTITDTCSVNLLITGTRGLVQIDATIQMD